MIVLLAFLLAIQAATALVVLRWVLAMNRSTREYNERLQQALLTVKNPVAAAEFKATDPSKSIEETLLDRADARFDWKPEGL